MRLENLAILAALALVATPLAAAEGRYVVCDNGLRCVKAPCPSSAIRNLDTGETFKSVSPDISGLSEADRQRIRDEDALYYGRLVLNGHVEPRQESVAGKEARRPTLVITGIVGRASAGDREHCRGS